MGTDEAKRQQRVTDQMLSSHAAMRDRLKFRARLLNIALLLFAVVLCGLTFLDERTVQLLGLSTDWVVFFLRVIALILFFLSLVEYRVDWSGCSLLHAEAANRLGELKSRFRRVLASSQPSDEELSRLSGEYWAVQSTLPPIPERLFPLLKAKHLRKVELSKRLDANPGRPLWLHKLAILLDSATKKTDDN